MVEFSTVFGNSGNSIIDKLVVTDLVVSNIEHKMKVSVASELSDVIKKLAVDQIKHKAGNVDVALLTD